MIMLLITFIALLESISTMPPTNHTDTARVGLLRCVSGRWSLLMQPTVTTWQTQLIRRMVAIIIRASAIYGEGALVLVGALVREIHIGRFRVNFAPWSLHYHLII